MNVELKLCSALIRKNCFMFTRIHKKYLHYKLFDNFNMMRFKRNFKTPNLSKNTMSVGCLCRFYSHGIRKLPVPSWPYVFQARISWIPESISAACLTHYTYSCGHLNHKKLHISSTAPLSARSGDEPLSDVAIKKQMDKLTDQFMEARDLLSDAAESKGTVYFDDDLKDAQAAIKETLEMYDHLLKSLTTEQKQHAVRTIGLKMQELRAQEKNILADLKE